MKNSTLLLIASILLGIMLVVCYFQDKQLNEFKDILNKRDTITYADTIYINRFIKDTVPTLKYKKVIVRDTLWKKDGEPQTINLINKQYQNTLIQDKDTIEYRADIEGYSLNNDSMPTLKSLDIRLKTMKVDNYTIIEKTMPQNVRKWSIQPSIGVGFGLIQKKPDIYVGVTLGYNIWSK